MGGLPLVGLAQGQDVEAWRRWGRKAGGRRRRSAWVRTALAAGAELQTLSKGSRQFKFCCVVLRKGRLLRAWMAGLAWQPGMLAAWQACSAQVCWRLTEQLGSKAAFHYGATLQGVQAAARQRLVAVTRCVFVWGGGTGARRWAALSAHLPVAEGSSVVRDICKAVVNDAMR